MSKDIRSYFNLVGSKKCEKSEGSEPSIVKKSTQRKRNIIDSDSDDDHSSPKRSKVSPCTKKNTKPVQKKSPVENSEKKSKYFGTNANNVFGSEPIKRIPPKTITKKKPVDEMQLDSAFEAELLQLDEVDIDSWEQKSNSQQSDKLLTETVNQSNSELGSRNNISPVKSLDQNYDEVVNGNEKSTLIDGGDSITCKEECNRTTDSKIHLGSRNVQQCNQVHNISPNVSPVKNNITKNKETQNHNATNQLKQKTKSKEEISSDSKYGNIYDQQSEKHMLWVDKYRPKSLKSIVGQQGDKSNVKKLLSWLKNWHKNHSSGKRIQKPSPWAKDDSGAFFKAALLSGPPGVGKTTSALLVCNELKFDVVEFNASDTRSKKMLHHEVSELLSSKSLTPFFAAGVNIEKGNVSKNHVLVMDEVDGMAGNEDRGGVQELIQLIKATRIPVICMCNDRNHPKIRSLANYCFDLRFQRPRAEQIRGAMMSICFKENLKIEPNTLLDIISCANQDIRLVLNHLSMLAAKNSGLTAAKKHLKLGPWDVVRLVFSKEEHKTMSIHDKCDLFFHDYSIAPLFVQENYLNVAPHSEHMKNKRKKMDLFSKAADSISIGDVTDKIIRTQNAWNLLPVQAIFSSYIPGQILEGHMAGQINFPSWLGKNSKRGKLDRLLQEVQIHSRLRVSASKEAMNLDYLVPLRDYIIQPLLSHGSEGVSAALNALLEYNLMKDDFDSLNELCLWPNSKDPMVKVESKVKAAFTRAYNKSGILPPYAMMSVIKKGKSFEAENDDEEEDDDEAEDDSAEVDAMITVKKKQSKRTVEESTTKPSSSKQKGSVGKKSRSSKK